MRSLEANKKQFNLVEQKLIGYLFFSCDRFIIDDAALYLSDKCSGSANIRSKLFRASGLFLNFESNFDDR